MQATKIGTLLGLAHRLPPAAVGEIGGRITVDGARPRIADPAFRAARQGQLGGHFFQRSRGEQLLEPARESLEILERLEVPVGMKTREDRTHRYRTSWSMNRHSSSIRPERMTSCSTQS